LAGQFAALGGLSVFPLQRVNPVKANLIPFGTCTTALLPGAGTAPVVLNVLTSKLMRVGLPPVLGDNFAVIFDCVVPLAATATLTAKASALTAVSAISLDLVPINLTPL
jgi:hypothetical protein